MTNTTIAPAQPDGPSALHHAQIEELPALAAAGRILAWRETLATIAATAEVEVMAACWAIRREHPQREAFREFVYTTLHDAISPAKAWQMADLWSIARKHRPVNEMVALQPREGVLFMAEVTRHLEIERTAAGDPELGPDEQEIVALALKPRRAMRAGLRQIAAERRAGREGRNADDVARIAQLEAEIEGAQAQPPARRAEAALRAFADQEAALAATAREIGELCAAGAYSRHARQRLLRIADNANSSVALIADASQGTGL